MNIKTLLLIATLAFVPGAALAQGTSTTKTAQTAASKTTATVKKVNIDTASAAQLMAIPGVSARWAREIAEYRPYNGNVAKFRRELGKYFSADKIAAVEQYLDFGTTK